MNLLPRRFYLDDFFDDFLEDRPCISKCDIYEENDEYHVVMDVPGFNKDNINIDFNDGYLTVEATQENKNEENKRNYIRRERSYNTIKRQFYIGNVDIDSANADFKDGILEIVIPKVTEEDTKKTIRIN